jgi:hypothetical protein
MIWTETNHMITCRSNTQRCWCLRHVPVPVLHFQVGIEECLHIEFEYDKARYHLKVSCVDMQAALPAQQPLNGQPVTKLLARLFTLT